jgi:hypothetical protein
MTYKVQLSLEAEKVFAKSNKTLAKKLARCFQILKEVLVNIILIAHRSKIYE